MASRTRSHLPAVPSQATHHGTKRAQVHSRQVAPNSKLGDSIAHHVSVWEKAPAGNIKGSKEHQIETDTWLFPQASLAHRAGLTSRANAFQGSVLGPGHKICHNRQCAYSERFSTALSLQEQGPGQGGRPCGTQPTSLRSGPSDGVSHPEPQHRSI